MPTPRCKMRPSTIQEQKVLKGFYELGDTIGTGGFGKVKLAKHILTGETVAVKIIDKIKLGDEYFRVEREIRMMVDLLHPRICKLYEVIESSEKLFMVLEYCPNGELFDLILDKHGLEEHEARRYFRQIVSAVAFMHKNGCAHRDLKPENLLLDEEKNIKIIDFGLAARPKAGIQTWLDTFCGSPQYVAPEILEGAHYLGGPADIWSLGIILYALHLGALPFSDDNTNKLYAKIRTGIFSVPKQVTPVFRSLIDAMLKVDPSQRLTMEAVLTHPWVMGTYNSPIRWDTQESSQDEKVLTAIESGQGGSELCQRIKSSTALKKFDYWMATFLILKKRSRLGKPIRLTGNPHLWLAQDPRDVNPFGLRQSSRPATPSAGRKEPLSPTKRQHSCLSYDASTDSSDEENDVEAGSNSWLAQVSGGFKDPNIFLPPKFPSAETPIGVLPAPSRITPSRSVDTGMDDDRSSLLPEAKNKSKSVDDSLDRSCNRTPPKAKAAKMVRTEDTPGSFRKAFGNLVNRLTPARSERMLTRCGTAVRVLTANKMTSNVAATMCKDPDVLLGCVKEALLKCGFVLKTKRSFRRNGLIFASKKNADGHVLVKLSMEVCWLRDRLICGYRRKRIEGDMFKYLMVLSAFENVLVIPESAPKVPASRWEISPKRLEFGTAV